MSSSIDKIIVKFNWGGPTQSQDGRLHTHKVSLEIQGINSRIHVSLPSSVLPSTPKYLPFTVTKVTKIADSDSADSDGTVVKETYPNLLKMTVEQIESLELLVDIFGADLLGEDPDVIVPASETPYSKIIPTFPEKIEEGQTYCLRVRSNESLVISACLVKVQSEKDKKLRGDRRLLPLPLPAAERDKKIEASASIVTPSKEARAVTEYLIGALRQSVLFHVEQFSNECAKKGLVVTIDTQELEQSISRAILIEVNKITPARQRELEKTTTRQQSESSILYIDPFEREASTRYGLRACIDVLGCYSLEWIIKGVLKDLGPIEPSRDIVLISEKIVINFCRDYEKHIPGLHFSPGSIY